jgi:DNA-binding transcriptional LysR family regulator
LTEAFRIQQMRQFLIAAETGSFRAAASGTSRSAPAVSTAMHDLELQVGAPLFEKGEADA